MSEKKLKFNSKTIHGGQNPDAAYGAVMPPIYQTSTYAQTTPGGHKGYAYSRSANPTRTALENSLASIENGNYGLAFASGIAAIDAQVFEKFGIKFQFIGMQNAEAIEEYITENTKLLWIETPTNPMMNIIDIKAVSKLARKHNVLLAADKLYFIQNASGAVCGPMDSFLTLRGIKTLHVRMQRHCENGKAIATYLAKHPKIEKVFWPGFKDHPNHEIAKSQMSDFGGGVESLAGHPASMTHASIPKEEREKSGVVDSLIRLSVGIEDKADLIADLEKAIG
ncbi:Cystathionine beta-lyase [Nymphon striatum]|nr:Cystathionine beta-lyase [Nymphon striatum]